MFGESTGSEARVIRDFANDTQFGREYDELVFVAKLELHDGVVVPEGVDVYFEVLVDPVEEAIAVFVDGPQLRVGEGESFGVFLDGDGPFAFDAFSGRAGYVAL